MDEHGAHDRSDRTRTGLLRIVLACAALGCGLLASSSSAGAATSASLRLALSPDRPRAHASLTVSISYSGGDGAGPEAPVRDATLMFPSGLSVEVPRLVACDAAALRARGPHGCPARSLLGRGSARAEAHVGSQTIAEPIALWAFLGPPVELQPTVEILAQGYTPYDKRFVFSGLVAPAPAPYGEQLALALPAIPTVPLEPDASISELSLTVGASRRHGYADSVLVPARCPRGGLPFAADFTYGDGSKSSTLAHVPCGP